LIDRLPPRDTKVTRRLLPAPRTRYLLALTCVFLLSMHVCVGLARLHSPLHYLLHPLHHQLVLLFLASIRGLSLAHMSVRYSK
jgi:hypothetical protein